jgi:hypothetical protein
MFKRLFGSNKKETAAPEPLIDISLGYNRLEEFKQYLISKQYQNFEEAYESLSWDVKTLLNEGIGLNEHCAADIQRWVMQRPDSYIANLFAGVSNTCLAWIARTAKRAVDVSEDNATRYIRLLEEALEYLTRADQLNDEDAEICARTIRVLMGLNAEEEQTLSYFNAAASFIPHHLMAHLMMLNYLTPKWKGSVEAMHDFADTRYAEGGSSLLIVLKLFAITEEWLWYNMNDENEKHKQFFKDESFNNSIVELYNNYREEEDGQLLIPYVYNYFAFLFWKMDKKELARELIKKIPGQMTIYPWAYMGVESNKQLQNL